MSEKGILVTGGNGLVGSCFFDFNQKYYLWGRFNCDLRDKNQLKRQKIGKWYNGIIHTAAKVGGVGSNMKYKGEFFYDNIIMNTNIIETAREEGIENLVVFLSTCIFPDDVEYPLTENKIHLGPPHGSNDAYAYAKRMADIQIRAYREQYGLNYKCVIPTNIYGINDNFNIDNGHVIPSLIHKCYLAKINNEPLIVWGTGKPLREFIYNKDVAKLTTWMLENYNESEPIILSPSEEISIKELVNMIVDIMDFKGDVIWDDTKPDGQYRKPTDNSKLRKYLPDFEFTPLYDGLSETIEWFINNYEKVRK
jgi:GDP-L-fucose synthase